MVRCPYCERPAPHTDVTGRTRMCTVCGWTWPDALPEQLELPLHEAGTITVP